MKSNPWAITPDFTISATNCVTSSVDQPHAIIFNTGVLKNNFLKSSPCYSWKYRFDISVGLLMFSRFTHPAPPPTTLSQQYQANISSSPCLPNDPSPIHPSTQLTTNAGDRRSRISSRNLSPAYCYSRLTHMWLHLLWLPSGYGPGCELRRIGWPRCRGSWLVDARAPNNRLSGGPSAIIWSPRSSSERARSERPAGHPCQNTNTAAGKRKANMITTPQIWSLKMHSL